VTGARLFVGTATGQLQARSAATGALLWSRPGATAGSTPAVTGGRVCASGFTAVNGQPIEVVDQFRL
jgi:outer membrane protein assembly factor BamB